VECFVYFFVVAVTLAAVVTNPVQEEVYTKSFVKSQLSAHGEKTYPSLYVDDYDKFADALVAHNTYLQTNKIYPNIKAVVDNFTCTVFGQTAPKPTSVHQLTIADIDVVAAIGDSLTAAFGAQATSIFNLFNDYRAVSWSGGGVGTVATSLTLPNFIKAYNPKVLGASTGTGAATTPQAVLNQAVTGALFQELMSQAQTLRSLLLANSSYNFANSWKLITLLIGPNNLCDVCEDYTFNNAVAYRANVEAVLDWIGLNIPKVFINLVPSLDVTLLYPLSEGLCGLLHGFECACAVSSDPAVRANVSAVVAQYYTASVDLANQAKYTQNDTWTVVVQPFLKDTTIPKLSNGDYDLSYFAPDCFHFSEKAHQCAAISLFNNMYEDVGSKSTAFKVGELIECPQPSPDYIKTVKNSAKKNKLMKGYL